MKLRNALRHAMAWCLAATQVTSALAQTSCPPNGIKWGVNAKSTDINAIGNILQARHFTQTRIGLWGWDPNNVTLVRNTASAWAAKGAKSQVILYTNYSNGYPAAQVCDANLATVEQNAYNTALNSVQKVEDLATDFELQNEVSLYPNMMVQGTNIYGINASDWNTPCANLQAAVLRGMSRAIVDERNRTGRPLRIILGVVNRHWGFLKFMAQQGVTWDVTGYHIYPLEQRASLNVDPWFGAGGPIGQLATFNKPITINEFNCGETYNSAFENQAGGTLSEACYRSFAKHVKEIVNHTQGTIESVLFYALQDYPTQATPAERRFGLMYDLNTPKVNLFTATAFAGGQLSGTEAAEVVSRNLLTQSQIDTWAGCGAHP